jgi:LysR family transcriptional regulator, low CO2-responsive transcriptional regulator
MQTISFRQLRLFVALVQTGSVSGAARLMHVTQPTASMQLREITQTVGVPLYEVISRKVRLTEAGHELARTARQIAEEWNLFSQRVDALKGLRRGKLRVAIVSTAEYFVPRLVGTFCRRFPDIEVSLEVLNRDGVVGRLRESLDDLYVMSMPPDDIELDDQVFMGNPLVLIAASGDPLVKRAGLTLSALSGQRFILRESGSGTRMAVDRHFRRRGFKARVRLELGSNEAIKEAVAGGLGLGVVSSHALHGREREYGVSVLPVEGFPIASSWHVVHPRARKISPIAEAFREHLLESAVHKRSTRSG